MAGFVKGAVAKRMAGDRPSTVYAALAAVTVGAATAVLTYRVIRS
jgi:1,4-dihydroxy-2-naphthoate octaprenyltransferase